MSTYEVVRLKCEECGRVRLVRGYQGDAAEYLSAPAPGEFLEWRCPRCDAMTEHEVLGKAEAAA